MTPHPEFTVLLARQRTGTNALRSVLETHPDICCFNEVFKISDRCAEHQLTRESNFFTFLTQYCGGDVTRAFPDRHEEVFSAYLSYLRELTPKRLLLVDVKYNSTHHLNGPFRETAEPTIFQSWKTRGIAVLHLTRRNVLRCVVSGMKAWESKRFDDLHGRGPADGRIHLPPTWTLARLEAWAAEDERMAAAFRDYERYKRVEYTDLFPDANGSIARGPLHDLAEWFGVPADGFRNRSVFHKQSSLPLDETIKNFPRIEAALRGTPFEAFLEDEPAYRKPAAVDR